MSFGIFGKPRIIYGLRGAVVKIAVPPSCISSSKSDRNIPRSFANLSEDELAVSYQSISSEFQRLCAFVDSKRVRFCGKCGNSATSGCTACIIFGFYRQISFLSLEKIRLIVNDKKEWTVKQLAIPASLQDVLVVSDDSTAAASAVCTMLNSLNEAQLKTMLLFGHHTRPLSFTATDGSSITNFINSVGLDCVSLAPNIKSSSGDILHRALHNFCSTEGNDWSPARAAPTHLPVFDMMTTGCPDALFRSLPLELKSVEGAEENFSGVRKWLRQISVYQRSHSPISHRALLVVANRSSRRICAYEVSPRNVPYFDNYCKTELAKRPELALYLDVIRPYCNASAAVGTRSSKLCQIFHEQKIMARSAMAAHAILLQTDIEEQFAKAAAFIPNVRKHGSVLVIAPSSGHLNSEPAGVDIEVPDFGRTFLNLRTLAQLFDRLRQADNRTRMEQSYTKAVDLLMDSAHACRDAAVVSFQKGDLPAAFRSLKFIKSLAVTLRVSAGSTLDIEAMPQSSMQLRIDELDVLARPDFLESPTAPTADEQMLELTDLTTAQLGQ